MRIDTIETIKAEIAKLELQIKRRDEERKKNPFMPKPDFERCLKIEQHRLKLAEKRN